MMFMLLSQVSKNVIETFENTQNLFYIGDDIDDPEKHAAPKLDVSDEIKDGCTGPKLLRAWICDSIPQYSNFTIQSDNTLDDSLFTCFQLISPPRNMITIGTYKCNGAQRFNFNLQRYDLCNPGKHSKTSTRLEVFQTSDPEELDIVAFLEGDVEKRRGIQIWSRELSDVDGCIDFVNPRTAKPGSGIYSKSMPMLGLWDA
jgi:hypothetical protein